MHILLKVSTINLVDARIHWSRRNIDETYLDFACSNLLQCMQSGLKYLITLDNKQPTSDDLHTMLEQLPALYKNAWWFDAINKNAAIYMDWNADNIIYNDVEVIGSDFDMAMEVCTSLVGDAKAVDKYSPQEIEWVLEELHARGKNASIEKVMELLPNIKLDGPALRSAISAAVSAV